MKTTCRELTTRVTFDMSQEMTQQQTYSEKVGGRTFLEDLRGKAIMFDVLKGGCGKSALSLNLADRLAEKGHNVLYMDLDPNGHVSFVLGYDKVYNDEMHDYGFVTLDKKAYSKTTLEPMDMVYETDFAFDFVPSFDDMESFEAVLNTVPKKEEVLAREFIHPLFEAGEYDYFIMDGGGERSNIADNGFYAGRTAIIPLTPGEEALSAWVRTWNRVIEPLDTTGFEIMALVPNLLSKRIDHVNDDRVLLERLNSSERFNHLLPEFASISDSEWERIDSGADYELPGIRERASISGGISEGMPVSKYDDTCDQIKNFEVLADVVERGSVKHEG